MKAREILEKLILNFCSLYTSANCSKTDERVDQALFQLREMLPKKKEFEYFCICDCLPCKTKSCDDCNLYEASNGDYQDGDLCTEGSNYDDIQPYNQAIDEITKRFE